MQQLVKIYVWHTEEGQFDAPTEQDLITATEYKTVPDELDIADQTKFDRTLRVHAVYDGGETLDCWLDVRDDERRWVGHSDWTSLSDMLDEYSYEID